MKTCSCLGHSETLMSTSLAGSCCPLAAVPGSWCTEGWGWMGSAALCSCDWPRKGLGSGLAPTLLKANQLVSLLDVPWLTEIIVLGGVTQPLPAAAEH